MPEITIQQSAGKQLGLTFLGVLMVATSAAILFHPIFLYKLVGIIGVAFFGCCLVFIVYRLIHPKPLLIINEHGFCDHSSLSSTGFFSWDCVENISLSVYWSQTFVSVAIKQEAELSHFPQKYQNVLLKANKSLGFPAVNITLNAAKEKPADVLEIMARYFHAHSLKKYGGYPVPANQAPG